MLSKLKTMALVAAASATLSVGAVAATYIDVRVARRRRAMSTFLRRAPAMSGRPATGIGAATAMSG
jgi:hypothetical protein